MRKIIVSEFVSIDDVMEGPGSMDAFKHAGWTMPYGSAEIMKFKYDELFAADALLLGRVTYEGFASVWPHIEGTGEFGERMNSMPKYVVSNTLQTLAWNNSHLIANNLKESLHNLKNQDGGDILVCGSAELLQTLNHCNFIDEYRLLVYPIVLGSGKRLFKEGVNIQLKLAETRVFDTGVTLLIYHTDASKNSGEKAENLIKEVSRSEKLQMG